MDLATIIDGADRFVAYVEELTSVIGHADRALPLRDYCAGLLTAEGCKSVRADGGGDGTGPSFGAISEALAFVGEGKWSAAEAEIPQLESSTDVEIETAAKDVRLIVAVTRPTSQSVLCTTAEDIRAPIA
jgi:hypothetical protein